MELYKSLLAISILLLTCYPSSTHTLDVTTDDNTLNFDRRLLGLGFKRKNYKKSNVGDTKSLHERWRNLLKNRRSRHKNTANNNVCFI